MRKKPLLALGVVAIFGVLLAVYYRQQPEPFPPRPEPQPFAEWQLSTSDELGFSVKHPTDWPLNASYQREIGESSSVSGYQLHVPAAFTERTNLSPDSFMSVEVAEGDGPSCTSSWFIPGGTEEPPVEENGRTWNIVRIAQPAADSFSGDKVYWSEVGGRCYGFRLFVRSMHIGNYEPGTVRTLDFPAIERTFSQFRATFTPAE